MEQCLVQMKVQCRHRCAANMHVWKVYNMTSSKECCSCTTSHKFNIIHVITILYHIISILNCIKK